MNQIQTKIFVYPVYSNVNMEEKYVKNAQL